MHIWTKDVHIINQTIALFMETTSKVQTIFMNNRRVLEFIFTVIGFSH